MNTTDTSGEVNERIAAYVCGELPPEDAAAFERQLAQDEGLRREVEAYRNGLEAAREWLEATPPGIERVEGLAIPLVNPPARSATITRLDLRRYAQIAVAAAAIFIVGFLSGYGAKWNSTSGEKADEGAREIRQSLRSEVPAPGQLEAPSLTKPTVPVDSEARMLAHAPPPTKAATVASTTRAVEKDGRLIVNTSLRNSGAQALWVIDSRFEPRHIANVSTQ